MGAALFLLSLPVFADYQDGLDAYSKGDYEQAMSEWRAVVSTPPSEVNPAIYAEAHFAIAKLYWLGAGVDQDYRQAHEWLLKAADLNHAAAQARLGFMYTDGLTVRQDFKQAFEWYSKAAKDGNVDGLYNLGIFYFYGWGVEQDMTLAAQYLGAASALGDAPAEEALQQVLAQIEERASREVESAAESAVGSAEAAPAVTVVEPLLRDEAWIRMQDPEHYTIQVMALRSLDNLRAQVQGFEELAPFASYTVQKSSNPLHVLLQGSYPDVESARAARDAFPRAIQKRDQLWIRKFGKVQARLGE